MSWLWRDDDRDHRWITAVHEAGHVVAAQLFGERGVGATVTDTERGARGRTSLRGGVWRGSDLDCAVFLLAGSAASQLLAGDGALADSDDLEVARMVAAESGTDLDEAARLAARLVRKQRRRIRNMAGRLYRHGQI